MHKLIISVIVCTYNRSELLSGCLQSLVEQTMDADIFEVIIVNNNSTDNTIEIAGHFTSTYQNFRIVSESNLGLSHARNCGFRKAKGEYVAYIDDDAVAQPDWLIEIASFIRRHPEAGAFGGPFSAICSVALPNWLPEGYGSWSLGEIERPVNSVNELPNGTNMIFRYDLLAQVGGFDKSLGMCGGRVGYGEDTKFLMEIVERDIPVFYAPRVKVFHRVLTNKLTISWFLKSHFQAGKDAERVLGCSRSLFSHVFCVGVSIVRGVQVIVLNRRLFLTTRLVRATVFFLAEVGGLLEHLLKGKGRG